MNKPKTASVSSGMNRLFPLPLTLLPLLLAAAPAVADHPRERPGEGRVILYAEANFRGQSLVLYPGDRLEDFANLTFDGAGPANDRVSSLRIEGPLEVLLFADAHFRGDALRARDSIPNLANEPGPGRRGTWNDLISSATVTRVSGPPPRPRWPDGPGRDDGPPPPRGPRVELYSDANYNGSVLILTPGDRVPNLGRVRFEDGAEANDRISSIRVFGGATVIIHTDANFQGERLVVEENLANLEFRHDRGDGRSWNDAISSLVVSTRQNAGQAETIVKRAFQELLGREPDAAALAHYARAIREQGYTENDLRQEIRRSREFRERDADSAVRRAYRELLRREADPEGLAHYTRLMVDQGWSESRVREALRRSDEFRQRADAS